MPAAVSTTTVMSIKTDKRVKEKAQKLAKKMGFPLGTVINAFLRQFVRDEAVSFSLNPKLPYRMSKKLEAELAEIHEDIKRGKNVSPVFDDMDEAIEYLRSAKIDEDDLS